MQRRGVTVCQPIDQVTLHGVVLVDGLVLDTTGVHRILGEEPGRDARREGIPTCWRDTGCPHRFNLLFSVIPRV